MRDSSLDGAAPRALLLAVGLVLSMAAGLAAAEPGLAESAGRALRFENPPDSPKRTSIITRLPAMIRKFARHSVASQTRDRTHILPHAAALDAFEASSSAQSSVTWIGHMTALLKLDGRYVLTDPWWASYASPVPGIGPRRYAAPALAIDELPPIDVVVVSHNHYDHLDLRAIARLPDRDRIAAVVPLGLGDFFRERGYGKVVELAWEESVDLDGVKITALPAIHWSKRSAFKKNDTLWAAFAIEGPNGTRAYFGGDSDYGPVQARLAARWGGFDLALLSIGGFHNDGVHCAPEACVHIGRDLGARVLVPLHWGTIYLGEGPPHALPARFASAAVTSGVDADDVWIMRIGETRVLPQSTRAVPQVPGTVLANAESHR
jgi:N-acyl-phosphatidylethanolamine-hydrolysing phospholipase D